MVSPELLSTLKSLDRADKFYIAQIEDMQKYM